MPAPSLTRHDGPAPTRGIVLMLHGGRADGLSDVEESSASWRRSRWMMRHVAPRLSRDGVAVWLLRYGVRGWNAGPGVVPSPVPDARWALEQVRREAPQVPVVLLGHSMGGRTAVAVADDPGVVGVVALAPWLPPGGTTCGAGRQAARGRARPPGPDHLAALVAGVLPGRAGGRRRGAAGHGPGRALHAAARRGLERVRGEPVAPPARGQLQLKLFPMSAMWLRAARMLPNLVDGTKPFRFIQVTGGR